MAAGAGVTVFATFETDTDYFGARTQQTMVNFRVRDLGAMLDQLRGRARCRGRDPGHGGRRSVRWVTDPEGNRIELWQPA